MRILICRTLIPALLSGLLAGCAGTFDYQSLYAQPGKFRFLRCQDLAPRAVGLEQREKELNSLIERAEKGPGGSVISPMVYGPELEQVRADRRELQQTTAEKNCDAPKAGSPASR